MQGYAISKNPFTMKNFTSFLTIVAILFFASCDKEDSQSAVDAATKFGATWNAIEIPGFHGGATTRSTVLQINVSKVMVQQSSGDLLTDLSSEYDLTGVRLEDDQYLRFEDANGNESVLTLTTNSYLGSNGALTASFAIGGNDLTGLTLKTEQFIIIDELIN